MDLAKLSIRPRLRNGWQAIDLGFAMARQWWWPAALSWAIPPVVLYLLASFLLQDYPGLPLILVWWCKPLWDRLPLMLASRALFSESLDVKAVLRGSWQTFKQDLLPSLTWRRFSPSRSFDVPVTLLEGLRGHARSQRLVVLHQSYGVPALWLTWVLFKVEFFLTWGIWSAVFLMVPEQFAVDWLGIYVSESAAATHLFNGIALLAMVLVAPFYCIAGFAMYICRRIELEGWDIEIRFRYLLQRASDGSKASQGTGRQSLGRAATVLAPLMLVLAMGLHATEAQAQAQQTVGQDALVDRYYQDLQEHLPAQEAKAVAVEVMSGEDFYHIESVTGWRLKKPDAESPDSEADPESVLRFLKFLQWLGEIVEPAEGLFFGLASGVEIAGWLLLIALVVFLIYRYRNGLLSILSVRPSVREAKTPEVLFGLDVRKESLPEDVCGQVRLLWQEGRQREAVGLLYRATLSRLIHQFAFQFSAGYTEQECVSVVGQADNAPLSEFLARLTRTWQLLAYAHRPPPTEQVNELCQSWQSLFGPRTSQGSASNAS